MISDKGRKTIGIVIDKLGKMTIIERICALLFGRIRLQVWEDDQGQHIMVQTRGPFGWIKSKPVI